MRSNKGQEEMVGFVVIVVLVIIAMLFILSFYVSRGTTDSPDSYEVESFIQSTLQYTTNCANFRDFFSVEELIRECSEDNSCHNGGDSCSILNSTLGSILDSSWNINNGSSVKGYEVNITQKGQGMISLIRGIKTDNSGGSLQVLPKEIDVRMVVYY